MQWLPETDLGMKETRNLSNSLLYSPLRRNANTRENRTKGSREYAMLEMRSYWGLCCQEVQRIINGTSPIRSHGEVRSASSSYFVNKKIYCLSKRASAKRAGADNSRTIRRRVYIRRIKSPFPDHFRPPTRLHESMSCWAHDHQSIYSTSSSDSTFHRTFPHGVYSREPPPPSSRPLKGDWFMRLLWGGCVHACDSLGQSLYSTENEPLVYIPTSGRGVCAVWFVSEYMTINQSNKYFLTAHVHYAKRIKSV